MKQGLKLILVGLVGVGVGMMLSGTNLASNYVDTVQRTFRDIKISLNGQTLTPTDANGKEVEPFIIDGTTYLPVRAVGTAMGLNVDWNSETSTVILSEKTGGESEKLAKDTIVDSTKLRNNIEPKQIECTFPQIRGFKNNTAQAYINSQITKNIQQYIQEIEYFIDSQTAFEGVYKLVTSYERYHHGKYLFLVVSYEYDAGGISSNNWKEIYSIDVEAEKMIYLSDLFKTGTNYESAIIQEINKQAEIKDIPLMGGHGISKLNAKQTFYIKEGELIIYFAPSIAASNTYGELSFTMPFTWNEAGYFNIE